MCKNFRHPGLYSPFGGFDPATAIALAAGRERMLHGTCGASPDPLERFWEELLEEVCCGRSITMESAKDTFMAYVKSPEHLLSESIVGRLFKLSQGNKESVYAEILGSYWQVHYEALIEGLTSAFGDDYAAEIRKTLCEKEEGPAEYFQRVLEVVVKLSKKR